MLFPPDFLRLFAAEALDHHDNLPQPLCSSSENVTKCKVNSQRNIIVNGQGGGLKKPPLRLSGKVDPKAVAARPKRITGRGFMLLNLLLRTTMRQVARLVVVSGSAARYGNTEK